MIGCFRVTTLKNLLLCFLLLLAACTSTENQPEGLSVNDGNFQSIIRVPVRLHLLNTRAEPQLNAEISEQELTELFEQINIIWRAANIKFYLESVHARPVIFEQDYLHAINHPEFYQRAELAKNH